MTTTLAWMAQAAAGEAAEPLAGLVAAASAGDRAALETLVETMERRVYTLAFRLVGDRAGAEDVAQEALWKVCQRLSQFRQSGNFWGWVYRIVLNQAHDHHRAGAREKVEIPEVTAPETYNPAREEQLRRAMAAMKVLSQKERAALVLIDLDGYSSREAARMMGCLDITARARAAQARKKVRRELSRYYPELREGI